MCGLAGIIDWRGADTALVAAMTDALKHRGPDAAGFWSNGPAALGHRRLSIIDLSHRADQPMADAAGRYQLIFNGEIYNYRALRPLLEQQGYRFHTESDTEVLLNAFIHWGAGCLERLNGMFAFAIWDAAEQRLTLARDRLGEKPLYFLRLDSGLVFASELKALRLHPAISREIDARALGQYLSLNYTLGNRCMVPGVEKLEPGHVLTYSRGEGVRIRDYWNLAQAFRNKRAFGRVDGAEEELRRNIEEAVSLRLVSDVPLGAFLSGGIDSATIVNAMRASRSGSDVKTFSIGFTERSYSELPEARQTAAHLGTDHRDKLAHWDLVEALPRIVRAADEPFADNSIIPTYFLSQFARQNVTVSLSGDGGDEIFGGYETYRANQLHAGLNAVLGRFAGPAHAIVSRGASLIPATFNKVGLDDKLRRFAAGLPLTAEDAHFSWRTVFDENEKQSLLHAGRLCRHRAVNRVSTNSGATFEAVDGCHYLDRAMYVDIKTWLPHDILHKVDRASMAHSLEVRAPYLDHHLVEFAAGLPVSLKVRGRATKYLLRRSQRRQSSPQHHRRPQARVQCADGPLAARRSQGHDAAMSSSGPR